MAITKYRQPSTTHVAVTLDKPSSESSPQSSLGLHRRSVLLNADEDANKSDDTRTIYIYHIHSDHSELYDVSVVGCELDQNMTAHGKSIAIT